MGGAEGDTHHGAARRLLMGFAALYPSYENNSWPRLPTLNFKILSI